MFTLKCENPSSTCTLLYPDFQPVWTFWYSSSRGTPSYKPYRPDVPPQRVGFRASLVIKRGVDFAHLVWNLVWFTRELRERMRVFLVLIPNE